MTSTPPLYDVQFLQFHVEAFAKTAVSNAVWLTGEWLAQKPGHGDEFSPKIQHLFEPRCWPESLRILDSLPAVARYKVFAVGFMGRPNAGDALFRSLVRAHPQMLREALDAQWMRVRSRAGLTGPQLNENAVAKELLLGFAGVRYNGQISNKD